jgi:hypothetical protein
VQVASECSAQTEEDDRAVPSQLFPCLLQGAATKRESPADIRLVETSSLTISICPR